MVQNDQRPAGFSGERAGNCSWTGPRELVKAVVDMAVSGEPEGEKKSAPIRRHRL